MSMTQRKYELEINGWMNYFRCLGDYVIYIYSTPKDLVLLSRGFPLKASEVMREKKRVFLLQCHGDEGQAFFLFFSFLLFGMNVTSECV